MNKFKFKVGDKVEAVDQSHGWGGVEKGEIGVITEVDVNPNTNYTVNFSEHLSWKADEKVLKKARKTYTYKTPKTKQTNFILSHNGYLHEFKTIEEIEEYIMKLADDADFKEVLQVYKVSDAYNVTFGRKILGLPVTYKKK